MFLFHYVISAQWKDRDRVTGRRKIFRGEANFLVDLSTLQKY